MHRECAEAFRARIGARCVTCRTALRWKWLLERAPYPYDPSEDETQMRTLRRLETRRLRQRAWRWRRLTWPVILHVIDADDDVYDAECALVSFYHLPDAQNRVRQALLDIGVKRRDDIDRMYREIIQFHDRFDGLHPSVRRMLQKALRQREAVDFEDPF